MAETTGIVQGAEVCGGILSTEASSELDNAIATGVVSSSTVGSRIESSDMQGAARTHEFRVELCHGTGSGGGIDEEVDPTIADYIKDISQQDINVWNGKLDSSLRLTNSELEEILK